MPPAPFFCAWKTAFGAAAQSEKQKTPETNLMILRTAGPDAAPARGAA